MSAKRMTWILALAVFVFGIYGVFQLGEHFSDKRPLPECPSFELSKDGEPPAVDTLRPCRIKRE